MAGLLLTNPAQRADAFELRGRTHFLTVPTHTRLINYRKVAFEGGAVFYLLLDHPSGADAGLGGLDLKQIRGVHPAFYYGPIQPTAFLGHPRRRGSSVPVTANFSTHNRSVSIRFQKPVPPGSTVTVAFRVGINPPADLYTFSVSALPWGEQPVAQSVGVVQMGIDDIGSP